MFHKPTLQYKLKGALKGALIMYGVLAAVLLFMGIAYFRFNTANMAEGSITFGGLGFASCIFLLVLGTDAVNEDLPLLLSFGISRKSQFQITLLCIALVSAAMSIFQMLASLGVSLIVPYRSLFVQAEDVLRSFTVGQTEAFARMFAIDNVLTGILWSAALHMLMFSIGFFMAAFFKSIPRGKKVFGIVGFVLFFMFVLPYTDHLLKGALGNLLAFLYGTTPLRHTVFFLVASAMLYALGYIFFRRLQIVAKQSA